MLAIFAYTSGYESWRDSSNWMTSSLHEEWFGVELHASTNRIITLNLGNNQLAGTIPTELGELTDLTRLHLTINSLTGTIPTELGELTVLYSLNLFDNELEGPIPTELGELTDLYSLILLYNYLTGPIPTELGELTALTTLTLSGNELEGPIPTELGEMTDLSSLYLQENQLTGPIPSELGELSALTILFLQEYNNLSYLPPVEVCELVQRLGANTDITTCSELRAIAVEIVGDCAAVVDSSTNCEPPAKQSAVDWFVNLENHPNDLDREVYKVRA